MKTKYTVDELADKLTGKANSGNMEAELLKTYYIRELYKQLGDPQKEDFPSEFKHAYRFVKMAGYTKDIGIMTKSAMEAQNNAPTQWCIKHASMTKMQIVEEYARDGWSCQVQSYNVLCDKYVEHPKHKKIWVRFYCSRDCAKYEYILREDADEQA